MKKLFYLFGVLLYILWSCNNDNSGVITMAIYPMGGKMFKICSFNEGDVISVNWGDRTVEEFITYGEKNINEELYITSFAHSYLNSNLTVITIKGNIKALTCFDEDLSLLDVSKCTTLVELECQYNGLTSLNVRKNSELTTLECHTNNLTSLDVSKCTKLTWLGCSNNNLTSLDVSKNTALTVLSCYDNNLTSLDVSKNTALTVLWCGGNNLTSLDVSKNTALIDLDCDNNNLSSAALNQIFRDLPQVTSGTIYIRNNPGTETCDKSIAENKGWEVNTPW